MGHTSGEHRWVWTRWPSIVWPTQQGGFGLRRLEEVVEAFSIKLWWNLRTKRSLLRRCMEARYFRHQHPANVSANNKASPVW
ncbi:uncharacterized protein M6B38_315865 [Iris pallida]|uniref:Uncharacterized protein n=1 Tax=Iris pallida TaxID=29817 RepID=A0AAX6HF28_IRIPA|nr:uncharacterized protein M6B38_315865 [Iris pallida]